MFTRKLLFLLVTGLLGTAASAQVERSYIDARTAAVEDASPVSGAVLVGDTLYLSGSIGLDENRQVPDDASDEARNVMNAIKRRVELAGLTMDDLVFVQIFCSDVAHYQAFNDVYRTYFTKEFPARAFIGAGTLLFDARYEVQAIAVRR